MFLYETFDNAILVRPFRINFCPGYSCILRWAYIAVVVLKNLPLKPITPTLFINWFIYLHYWIVRSIGLTNGLFSGCTCHLASIFTIKSWHWTGDVGQVMFTLPEHMMATPDNSVLPPFNIFYCVCWNHYFVLFRYFLTVTLDTTCHTFFQ